MIYLRKKKGKTKLSLMARQGPRSHYLHLYMIPMIGGLLLTSIYKNHQDIFPLVYFLFVSSSSCVKLTSTFANDYEEIHDSLASLGVQVFVGVKVFPSFIHGTCSSFYSMGHRGHARLIIFYGPSNISQNLINDLIYFLLIKFKF